MSDLAVADYPNAGKHLRAAFTYILGVADVRGERLRPIAAQLGRWAAR